MRIIGEHSITSGNMTSDIQFLNSCKVVINTQQEYEMLKQAVETFNQGAFGLGACNTQQVLMNGMHRMGGGLGYQAEYLKQLKKEG